MQGSAGQPLGLEAASCHRMVQGLQAWGRVPLVGDSRVAGWLGCLAECLTLGWGLLVRMDSVLGSSGLGWQAQGRGLLGGGCWPQGKCWLEQAVGWQSQEVGWPLEGEGLRRGLGWGWPAQEVG